MQKVNYLLIKYVDGITRTLGRTQDLATAQSWSELDVNNYLLTEKVNQEPKNLKLKEAEGYRLCV